MPAPKFSGYGSQPTLSTLSAYPSHLTSLGHGSQRRATMGDELDGMDETILPSDFKSAGQIIDNELNAMLVWMRERGVNLNVVVWTADRVQCALRDCPSLAGGRE
eukprot:353138-Chlamydomonas_euryale.AAC.5